MRSVLCVAILGCLPSPQAAVFESGLWPGEGRPVFEAATTSLPMHEAASTSSRLVGRVSLGLGSRLDFDSTWFRTVVPGQFLAQASTTIRGRLLGTIRSLSRDDYYSRSFGDTVLHISEGDTIEYLQYRAEGTCFVRMNGKVIDAQPCPNVQRSEFQLAREPALEWWIRVKIPDSRPGWVLVSDTTVTLVSRTF